MAFDKIKYISKWNKENSVKKTVSFNKAKDREILNHVDDVLEHDSFSGYVKNLIRDDMCSVEYYEEEEKGDYEELEGLEDDGLYWER